MRQIAEVECLHLGARPGSSAKELQAGRDARIEREATDVHRLGHLWPADALDQLVQDLLERNPVEGVLRLVAGHPRSLPQKATARVSQKRIDALAAAAKRTRSSLNHRRSREQRAEPHAERGDSIAVLLTARELARGRRWPATGSRTSSPRKAVSSNGWRIIRQCELGRRSAQARWR